MRACTYVRTFSRKDGSALLEDEHSQLDNTVYSLGHLHTIQASQRCSVLFSRLWPSCDGNVLSSFLVICTRPVTNAHPVQLAVLRLF